MLPVVMNFWSHAGKGLKNELEAEWSEDFNFLEVDA